MASHDDRSRDPGRGQMALARSLPLLIFTLCAAGVIAVLAFRNFDLLNQTAVIYDAAAPLCSTTPPPITAAAPYNPSADFHPSAAFIVRGDGVVQPDDSYLPDGWTAENIGELELVLCLQNERPALRPLCDNAAIINQYGLEIEARLLEANTGRLLAADYIPSTPLAGDECIANPPDTIPPIPAIFPNEPIQEWLKANS